MEADIPSKGRITRWLERVPQPVFVTYAAAAAFCTYFGMYAFRKPFAAASYEGLHFLGTTVDLKTAFVISQILGYTLSKYIGIKVVSEHIRDNRGYWLVALIATAEAALLLFAVLPANVKVIAIFLNGLPLGMVWGMVVSYLEGRRTSDLLLAALCSSFILSSGVVKDVGVYLMEGWSVPEFWMPFATGAVFLPAFLVAVFFLNQLPRPSVADMDARHQREPMRKSERRAFVSQLLLGMVMLLTIYFFLTAYRDFRDNYGIEIFGELGYEGSPAIFTRTELPVAFGVILCMAGLNLIRSNKWGLFGAFMMMLAGSGLMVLGTMLLDAQTISGATFMIMVGLGSYLVYVPYNSVLFERIMAHTRVAGTAVFAIYLADALGYTGSVGVQLYKDLFQSEMTRLGFFKAFTYGMAALGLVLTVFSCLFFMRRRTRERSP